MTALLCPLHYWVRAKTGWPGVSVLYLQLLCQCGNMCSSLSRSIPEVPFACSLDSKQHTNKETNKQVLIPYKLSGGRKEGRNQSVSRRVNCVLSTDMIRKKKAVNDSFKWPTRLRKINWKGVFFMRRVDMHEMHLCPADFFPILFPFVTLMFDCENPFCAFGNANFTAGIEKKQKK